MTIGASGARSGPLVADIALQSGGAFSLWPDRLEVAGKSYPVADISWAGLVNDPAAPQGAQPLPAVAWRMADGQYASATPADPPHAWQILEALFAQRPDLRIQLPPPASSSAAAWGSPSSYGYAAYGYAPYGYAPPQSNNNEAVMAGLAHLSIFFGALIVPLILWLVNRGKAAYAAQQSKQAFFFHLGVFVVEMVVGVGGFLVFFASASAIYQGRPDMAFFSGIFILYGIVFVIQIVAIVFGVIGAVKAFKGEPFHYPLMGRI